jgi:hypothetical protein
MLSAVTMWAGSYLAADAGTLNLSNPAVLGPIAGFVFVVFVAEIIIPGKSYKREVEENKRLRELVETVVPLSEKMVESNKVVVETLSQLSSTLNTLVDVLLADDNPADKLRRGLGKRQ